MWDFLSRVVEGESRGESGLARMSGVRWEGLGYGVVW